MLPPLRVSIDIAYTSRFATRRALSSMNCRRGSTWSPISIEKILSAWAASSTVTRTSVRRAGSIVVSRSWAGFISPSPLKRFTSTPRRASSSTCSRNAAKVSACARWSPRRTENGGVPALSTSASCTRSSWWYSLASISVRRSRWVRASPDSFSIARTTISDPSWERISVEIGCPFLEDPRLLDERQRIVPVGGPQRRRPSLVLLEQAAELLPARLGEREAPPVTVEDLKALELAVQQDLLEL